MDIILNRSGGVSVRDQLVAQLELKILGGDYAPGTRLPSVRTLARLLKVHANTVSAAYQELAAIGHVSLQRGSGVFVRGGAATSLETSRGLDEMIRLALRAAFAKGYSGSEIRGAVERWLAASPPDHAVIVDSSREMAELMAHEIKIALGVSVECRSVEEIAQKPGLLSGALVLALPYHIEAVNKAAPNAALETMNLELPQDARDAARALPEGSIVLVVSHSPTVLPFANVILKTQRGTELLVEGRVLSQPTEWRRLLPAADAVFADALSIAAVRKARPGRVYEFRVVSGVTLKRLRDTLTIVVPGRQPRRPEPR